jgi:hypothetical protein
MTDFGTDVEAKVEEPIRWGAVAFLVVMALVFGAPGFAVLPAGLRDWQRGAPNAQAGLVFTLVIFVLPSIFCAFVAARIVLKRTGSGLLPWWLWRIVALLLTAVTLAVGVAAVAQGSAHILGPLLPVAYFAYRAWAFSRRPGAEPEPEEGIEIGPS